MRQLPDPVFEIRRYNHTIGGTIDGCASQFVLDKSQLRLEAPHFGFRWLHLFGAWSDDQSQTVMALRFMF